MTPQTSHGGDGFGKLGPGVGAAAREAGESLVPRTRRGFPGFLSPRPCLCGRREGASSGAHCLLPSAVGAGVGRRQSPRLGEIFYPEIQGVPRSGLTRCRVGFLPALTSRSRQSPQPGRLPGQQPLGSPGAWVGHTGGGCAAAKCREPRAGSTALRTFLCSAPRPEEQLRAVTQRSPSQSPKLPPSPILGPLRPACDPAFRREPVLLPQISAFSPGPSPQENRLVGAEGTPPLGSAAPDPARPRGGLGARRPLVAAAPKCGAPRPAPGLPPAPPTPTPARVAPARGQPESRARGGGLRSCKELSGRSGPGGAGRAPPRPRTLEFASPRPRGASRPAALPPRPAGLPGAAEAGPGGRRC